MKKLNVFLISLLLMAFYSCSKEEKLNKLPENNNYGVAFSIEGLSNNATCATASPIEGTMAALNREKNINELYAVVYQGEVFYKVAKANLDVDKYSFDMEKAGNFDVYLVANPDATLIDKMKTEANTPGSLKNLLVEQEVGADNKATNFLMTAEPFNVTTEATKTVTHATAVSLVRLAARVDFYNTVQDLSMTKITFKNRVTTSMLVDSKTHNKGLKVTPTKAYQAAEGLESTKCIGAIYSYENNEKGNVAFTLDATYKGAAIQKEITFDDLPLKRNYLYHVIISEATAGGGGTTPEPGPNNLKVNIKVADWNTAGVLEWKGEKLIGGTPTFTATGAGVTGSSAQSPVQVDVPRTQTTVTITTVGNVTYPVLEAVDALPADIKFTKGAKSSKNAKVEQVYTINVGVNAAPKSARSFKFSLVNPLDISKKVDFVLVQGELNINIVSSDASGAAATNNHTLGNNLIVTSNLRDNEMNLSQSTVYHTKITVKSAQGNPYEIIVNKAEVPWISVEKSGAGNTSAGILTQDFIVSYAANQDLYTRSAELEIKKTVAATANTTFKIKVRQAAATLSPNPLARFANANVGELNQFADVITPDNLTDYDNLDKYYQWGRNVAFDYNGTVSTTATKSNGNDALLWSKNFITASQAPYIWHNGNLGTSWTDVVAKATDAPASYTGTNGGDPCPAGYRLPEKEEFYGIMFKAGLKFDGGDISDKNISEDIKVGGTTATYTADYYSKTPNVIYGLKMKGNGNTHLTAYRWEYKRFKGLWITSRVLGSGGASIKVEDIANDNFWNNENNSSNVIRYFPTMGYRSTVGGKPSFRGGISKHWSSVQYLSFIAWTLYSDSNLGGVFGNGYKADAVPIRPILK